MSPALRQQSLAAICFPWRSSLRLIIAILALITISLSIEAKNLGSCEYYRSLAHELKCPDNDYLIQFGERYCQRFDRYRQYFTPIGQRMLKRIKLCLQTSLYNSENLTCENVKAIALDSHIECYKDANFCEMPLIDKNRLGLIVAEALFDPDYRSTILVILNSCNNRQ